MTHTHLLPNSARLDHELLSGFGDVTSISRFLVRTHHLLSKIRGGGDLIPDCDGNKIKNHTSTMNMSMNINIYDTCIYI